MYARARVASLAVISCLAMAVVSRSPAAARKNTASIEAAYAERPLTFEPNRGQTNPRVEFVTRGPGYAVFLTRDGAVMRLRTAGTPGSDPIQCVQPDLACTPPPTDKALVQMRMLGVGDAGPMRGVDPLPGHVNYFIGDDPAGWRSGIPTFRRVVQKNVYPGIDVTYYGKQQKLEYDFLVAPGNDPSQIKLRFDNASTIRIDEQGALVLGTDAGDVRLAKPEIYQEIDGYRHVIDGGYALDQSRDVGFEVAAYDPTRPLVIDPIILFVSYSTFIGGSGNGLTSEGAGSVALSPAGYAVVGGEVDSLDFPTVFPAQPSIGGNIDAFVTRIGPDGTVVFSTYLGGTSLDRTGFGRTVYVDKFGRAFVAGRTFSTNFPTTTDAYQRALGGGGDAFLVVLGPAGALEYGTYLGGSDDDGANALVARVVLTPPELAPGLTVVYLTGDAESTDFPTVNPHQATPVDREDAFLSVLQLDAPPSSQLIYSTLLGGSGRDIPEGVELAGGDIVIAGRTDSPDFPTLGPIQGTFGGDEDGFVARIDRLAAPGSQLIYSTYLGGTDQDRVTGLATDATASVYVVGFTRSPDFPVANAPQPSLNGTKDCFLAKIDEPGAALVYSTYFGGSGGDACNKVRVDSGGNVYVTGAAGSADFPVLNAFQPDYAGGEDAMVAKFDPDAQLLYSSFLGGVGLDTGEGLAIDDQGVVVVAGTTLSDDFPTKNAAFPALSGTSDGFVTRIREFLIAMSAIVDAPFFVSPNDPVEATFSISNDGPGTAIDVTLDVFISGARFHLIDVTTIQGSCKLPDRRPGKFKCQLGTIYAGGRADVRVIARPLEPSRRGFFLKARVKADGRDSNRKDNLVKHVVAVR